MKRSSLLLASLIASAGLSGQVQAGPAHESSIRPGSIPLSELPVVELSDAEAPAFDASTGTAEYRTEDGERVLVLSKADEPRALDQALFGLAPASTASTAPTSDTWTQRTTSGWVDYGRSCELRAGNIASTGGPAQSSLLYFRIPQGVTCTTISNATLYVKTSKLPSAMNIQPFQVTSTWAPGATGASGCSTCAVTTGSSAAFPAVSNAAGGAAVSVTQTCTTYAFDVTSMVQAWCTGASPNYGVRLAGTSGSSYVNFHSMEATTAADRPTLVITY